MIAADGRPNLRIAFAISSPATEPPPPESTSMRSPLMLGSADAARSVSSISLETAYEESNIRGSALAGSAGSCGNVSGRIVTTEPYTGTRRILQYAYGVPATEREGSSPAHHKMNAQATAAPIKEAATTTSEPR